MGLTVSVISTAFVNLHARDGSIRARAEVDPTDVIWLAQFNWCVGPGGYAARGFTHNGKIRTMFMHRQILGLSLDDPRRVDHINRNNLDNRRENLRLVDNAKNAQNRSASGNVGSKSKYRGVTWHKGTAKWQARVTVNYKTHHIGYFDDEDTAGAAAQFARDELMTHSET
jgi:hypothetical protein